MKQPVTIALAGIFMLLKMNCIAQLQVGGLYGVGGNRDTGTVGTLEYAIFNPVAGSSNSVSQIYSGKNFGYNGFTIDPLKNRGYLLIAEGQFYPGQPNIMTIDLVTGNVISNVTVQSLDNDTFYIDKPIFNYKDSLLYTLYRSLNLNDSLRVVTIDPIAGILTPVFRIPPGATYLTTNGFDVKNQKLYAVREEDMFKNFIVEINLINHSISSIPIAQSTDYFSYDNILAFSCNDGMLYGIETNYENFNVPSTNVVRINPANGNRESLLPFSQNVLFASVAIDPGLNKLYPYGESYATGKAKFATYDIGTNAITYSPEYIGYLVNNSVLFDIYYPLNFPNASFSASNFCLHGKTLFSFNGKGENWFWNFDDPASGNADNSNTSDPAHEFTAPGAYNVQLIVSNCLGADTIVKQITIEDFPSFNIGHDSSLCSNSTDNVIDLHLSLQGTYNYTWSDGGTDTSLVVTTPGIYWVSVAADCGIVSDTVTITPLNCPCTINIFPDLTLSKSGISIDCDLHNLENLHAEVYNMLGQAIRDFEITDPYQKIDFTALAPGMYLVRVRSGNKTLATQKIIFQK